MLKDTTKLTSIDGNRATTSTGVELTLDWTTLSISQYGRDTRWIDRIYSIHYLEWTGIQWIDQLLGLIGLLLLMIITYTGSRMAFGLEGKRLAADGSDVTQSVQLQSRNATSEYRHRGHSR